jgi:hypothetical protein
MKDSLNIQNSLFRSGLQKKDDAVITTASNSISTKVIFNPRYQRNGLMGTEFQGAIFEAMVPFDTVENWNTDIEPNADTITISGKNNNNPYKIREVKPNEPSFTILVLSYD